MKLPVLEKKRLVETTKNANVSLKDSLEEEILYLKETFLAKHRINNRNHSNGDVHLSHVDNKGSHQDQNSVCLSQQTGTRCTAYHRTASSMSKLCPSMSLSLSLHKLNFQHLCLCPNPSNLLYSTDALPSRSNMIIFSHILLLSSSV